MTYHHLFSVAAYRCLIMLTLSNTLTVE